MHVIRSAADDAVNIGSFEDFSIIGHPFRTRVFPRGSFQTLIVDVAQDRNVLVRDTCQIRGSSSINANHCQIQLFIRTFRSSGGQITPNTSQTANTCGK